ncbi:hypothetical protein MKK55_18005 [Methylobacterium sp. J-059]|uniref:hypothetical protein n=1 Tax=Methylobacterium sp. J-059 TaxID=2836643 RepID=UPI001FBBDB2B|nr:hypothetical protein [Methylobacterium sp. J-059]MCJ2040827.1 hypothetical protein [Methylobacterium sp. J-059]
MTQGRPLEQEVFIRPRPECVAQIADGYGPDAADERWFWCSPSILRKLAQEGRSILRSRAGQPSRSSYARSTTPEQDAAVIAAVARLGCVSHAAAEVGVTVAVVHRVLRENGTPAPRVDRSESGRRAYETRRRRAA